MTIAFVIDMNLSAEWLPVLEEAGWTALHWSTVGDPAAADKEIMDWARLEGRAVLTHDLDFDALLAATGADSPSVVLLRGQDVLPERLGTTVVAAIRLNEPLLARGALLVIDLRRSRVRVLPLGPLDPEAP